MLLELDGKPLASSAALHRVLRQVSPGARVQLRVLRDTRLLTIELVTREAVAAA
jgi:S1-C subfamily serine protease